MCAIVTADDKKEKGLSILKQELVLRGKRTSMYNSNSSCQEGKGLNIVKARADIKRKRLICAIAAAGVMKEKDLSMSQW